MLTEKEKMLQGQLYQAGDPELVAERLAAKTKTFGYNHLHPEEFENGKAVIRELFGDTGKQFHLEPPVRVDYGYNISIGENFYSNYNLVILDCARVNIGDNVFIAPNVCISTAGHPIHHEPRTAGWEFALPISIGNNVWIGANVVINPGVTIGDNTVIGSGAVVTKDIPANVVAAGVPCRVLRNIGEDEKG